MMSDSPWFDRPGRELEDYEYPDVPEDNDEDATQTVACPECGTELYEDALRCPVCEAYITPNWGNPLGTGRPIWWIVLGLLGIVAVIVVLAFF